MAANTTVESEILETFLPDLVTAVCDDVQRITDQCLANGLITDSKRRRILERRGSENQARALIQCIQNSTKSDNRCFDIFLDSLERELPRLVKEKLLSDMRRDLAERAAIRTAVIPTSQRMIFQLQDDHDQLQCRSSLFGRYENSFRENYTHASVEKTVCEESLQSKANESGRLRANLEILRNQSCVVDTIEIDSNMERLSTCEMEIASLKERIETVEGVIQEEDMQARRGKSTIFASALMEKEMEHKRLLKEREEELQERMQKEMKARIKGLESKHEMALRKLELRIKELELVNASLRMQLQGMMSFQSPDSQPNQQSCNSGNKLTLYLYTLLNLI